MTEIIWNKLTAQVAREDSELAAQAFLDAGCGGVQIDDVRIEDRGEDAVLIETPEVLLVSYCEQEDAEVAERLSSALSAYSIHAKIEVEEINAPDFTVSWRENFPVLHIGGWTIAPTWEDLSAEDGKAEEESVIRLDPGLAFGTGQHPTTQMCLEILGERRSRLKGKTLLDVGCGSGVLSIAAAKAGAQVVASDLDPHCTSATLENAELNNVSIKVVEAAGVAWTKEKFDIVIANLMSDLLISLADELARVTQSTLIVSGISAERADEVEAALTAAGLRKTEKRERDGEERGERTERWAAFVFEAASPGSASSESASTSLPQQ